MLSNFLQISASPELFSAVLTAQTFTCPRPSTWGPCIFAMASAISAKFCSLRSWCMAKAVRILRGNLSRKSCWKMGLAFASTVVPPHSFNMWQNSWDGVLSPRSSRWRSCWSCWTNSLLKGLFDCGVWVFRWRQWYLAFLRRTGLAKPEQHVQISLSHCWCFEPKREPRLERTKVRDLKARIPGVSKKELLWPGLKLMSMGNLSFRGRGYQYSDSKQKK